jgi:hypothetical protein
MEKPPYACHGIIITGKGKETTKTEGVQMEEVPFFIGKFHHCFQGNLKLFLQRSIEIF